MHLNIPLPLEVREGMTGTCWEHLFWHGVVAVAVEVILLYVIVW
jgi:hypothetical protein